ncbi:unnamed protein product [Schistosoma margrebowiei]|uniref:Uncharacterized protein n=1 Tax=Schistosoma margrebowiei TaxID=48269 RepID=A0A3P7Z9H7_9TREM|nr:unnamed protein product [Schistosoma margrebowiei]
MSKFSHLNQLVNYSDRDQLSMTHGLRSHVIKSHSRSFHHACHSKILK